MTDSTDTTSTPPTEKTWGDLGLSPDTLTRIIEAGYTRPTPVQGEAIPLALDGHDVIASAQTGTGKTASFVLPIVERLAGREGTYALILAPTREIAQQTQATLEFFGKPRNVRSIVLIGGIDMRIDAAAIQTYPQVIVATPGRLCDHLDRGNIWLDYIEMVVLDEADRMLNMGFADQLNRIMEDCPESRQTLLFSATYPPAVERLARKILHDPKRVAIGRPMTAAKTVSQRLFWMEEDDKRSELVRLLGNMQGSTIVFTRTKDTAQKLWRYLHSRNFYDATVIHSDLQQQHREQALAAFKSGQYRILVATDVAGRGIHVDDVQHVVNFDLPMDPEDYIHRIGRTGRAETTGESTTFATSGSRDRRDLAAIEKLLGKSIPVEKDLRKGARSPRPERGERPPQRPAPSSSPVQVKAAADPSGVAPAADNTQQAGAPNPGGPNNAGGEGAKKRRRRRGRRGGRGGGGEKSSNQPVNQR